jgi:hypothetical protein
LCLYDQITIYKTGIYWQVCDVVAQQALFVATDAVQIAVQNAGDGAAAPGHQTFQQEHQQDGAMQQSCWLPKVSSKSGRWGYG